ncbi:hypothetical protein Tco_0184468 [Tanacetum coccineum]
MSSSSECDNQSKNNDNNPSRKKSSCKEGMTIKSDKLDMKAMQDNVKAGLIPFKTGQEILDEIIPSDNRQNMSGMGRKLPGDVQATRARERVVEEAS